MCGCAVNPFGNVGSGVLACEGGCGFLRLGPFDLKPGVCLCDPRGGDFELKLVLGRIDPDDGLVRGDRPAVSEIGRDPDHAAADFGGDSYVPVQGDPSCEVDPQRLFGRRRLNHGDGWLGLVERHVGNGVALHAARRLCEVEGDSDGGQYQDQLRVAHPFGTAGSTLGLCRFLCHRLFQVRLMGLRRSDPAKHAAERPRTSLSAPLPSYSTVSHVHRGEVEIVAIRRGNDLVADRHFAEFDSLQCPLPPS